MQDNLSRCACVPLLRWLGGEHNGPWGSISGAQAWPVVGHLLAAVGTTAQPTEGISSEHLLVMSWVCPEAWALISLSFLSHIIVCILIKHIGVLSSLSDTSFFFFFSSCTQKLLGGTECRGGFTGLWFIPLSINQQQSHSDNNRGMCLCRSVTAHQPCENLLGLSLKSAYWNTVCWLS